MKGKPDGEPSQGEAKDLSLYSDHPVLQGYRPV